MKYSRHYISKYIVQIVALDKKIKEKEFLELKIKILCIPIFWFKLPLTKKVKWSDK